MPFELSMRQLIVKKRLQEIAEEAKFSGGLVLLLDEIHRLDKTKARLPLASLGKWTGHHDWRYN